MKEKLDIMSATPWFFIFNLMRNFLFCFRNFLLVFLSFRIFLLSFFGFFSSICFSLVFCSVFSVFNFFFFPCFFCVGEILLWVTSIRFFFAMSLNRAIHLNRLNSHMLIGGGDDIESNSR